MSWKCSSQETDAGAKAKLLLVPWSQVSEFTIRDSR